MKNRKNQNDEETKIQINQNGQSRNLRRLKFKIIQDLTEQNNKLKTELNSVKKELEELKNNSPLVIKMLTIKIMTIKIMILKIMIIKTI